MRKRVTIKDVAEKAGVTIGTVSHVINGTASISAETTARVNTCIEKMGYIPNIAARSIRAKNSHVIGLLIPKMSNAFYSSIATEFMEEADKEGYTVLIASYEYDIEKEKSEIQSLVQNNARVIVLVNGSRDEDILQWVIDSEVRLIFADRRSNLRSIPCVEFDNIAAMREMVSLLKNKGYRSVGYISEPLEMTNLTDRYEGYIQGLQECGFPRKKEFIYVSKAFQMDHMKQAYRFMSELLDSKKREELPDVFMCSSDMLAIGVLRSMMDHGFRIPGDFGVVGFDDLEISGFVSPSLTTVHQDRDELGKVLWKMVQESINKEQIRHIVLKQRIIERESC